MTDEAAQFDRIVSIVRNLVERIHPGGCHWKVRRYTVDGTMGITLPTMRHPYWTGDMWMTFQLAELMPDDQVVAVLEQFMRDGDDAMKERAK